MMHCFFFKILALFEFSIIENCHNREMEKMIRSGSHSGYDDGVFEWL